MIVAKHVGYYIVKNDDYIRDDFRLTEILILGGTVVTMDQKRKIIKNGAVAIKDNIIEEVGKADDLTKRYHPDRTVEAEGRLVLPGFVNVHHHTQSSTTKMRGIQMETPGGLYGRSMPIKEFTPPQDRYYLGMAAIMADVRMGVTTDADQDFGETNIARAMNDIGIRSVVAEYIYSVDFQETREKGYKVFAPELEDKTLKAGLDLIDEWDGAANGRITCDLAPHAPDTCTPELLGKVREEANKRGKMITTHLAQVISEMREVKSQYGVTPFQYLLDNDILGHDCYVAHCIYHTDQDIRILADTDTKVCHCALGMSLGGRTAPLIPWLEAGITVGLGLDDRPDMIRNIQATMTVAAYRKAMLGQGYRPKAYKLLELATIEGAKVLGKEREIGSLEKGKKADITIVDMRKPHLQPSLDPIADLVYFANGNDVETVVIDGKVIVMEGKILTVDVREMLLNAQKAGERAWQDFYDKSL